MNVDDLIDINQEVVEAEEPQLGQIPRNPKVYLRRINPFEEYDDLKFKQIYRISKNLAENIINMVHQQISMSNRGGGISPALQVLATIRYLAKGAYEQDIGDIHGISQSSMSNIIARVVRAIAANRDQYIYFPEGREVDVVKEDFFQIGNCPSIVGAIDCTHIKIKCPGGDNPLLYINRKGYYSLNVQVVSDAKCKIRDIVARWRGSSHDSRIWNQCSLRRKFENGEINGILLGDNGYTCTRYLLTPLLNPVTDADEAYNRSHIRTRNVVERLFGQWKNKFRCFFNGMQISLDTAKAAIIALAIIHNMCIDDNQENSGAEDDVHRFTGNDTHTDYFRLVLRDGDSLLIGGRNLVYNLTLVELEEQQRLTWYSNEIDANMCVVKGKDEEICQNYIRIMAKTASGRLLLCGTNAFKPICREYNILNRNYTVEKEKPGQAVCPYDPHHNSTAIYVDGDLYTGTVADFSGMDPIIYREPLQTEQYDSMSLNAPDFVGSMAQGDFVYFFFRETAVEYINCGKAVYSRVARVCKNDRGGPHRFRNRWTSFLKSRLNCSVTGEFPFAFNEIQSTTDLIDGKYGDVSAQLIYGTFTTPPNSISGSAVCAFSLQDITDTFEGNFKEQAAINSNWLPVLSNKVPDPRPGQCHNDSRTLPDLTLNFIKTHSLMDESVPSFFGQPIVIRTSFHYRFTQIAVDPQVKVPGGKTYDVLFIGTDNGKVIKAVNGLSADSRQGVRPVVVEEIQVFPAHVPVRGVRIMKSKTGAKEETRLVVISDTEVQSLKVHRCDSNKISSCSECVALQDPYCAWDKVQGKCRSKGSGRWGEESYFFQSVATGEHTACPPPKLGKDASSVGGLSSSQPKYNPDHPTKDLPDGQVINIIQDKPYESSGPAVTAADTLPAHYSVETLIMAVVAGSVSALVVGFFAGYLCGRKCHKDEDDNLPYPDTEYEYFEQRQNMNSRIAAEPKLLPQEEVTYAEPVLVPQPPPKLHSPKNTLRKGPHQNNAETLFQFQTDAGYNGRDNYRGRDNFGTLRSHQLLQGDNYRRGDGFATTRSVKKVYL